MKKIVPLLVLLAVVVLAGCSFNTESGQGFMKFDKTKKAPAVTTCPSSGTTVYSYTTQTGDSQAFEYKTFDELYSGLKAELQNNGGKPSCPYRFTMFQTGDDGERNDTVICGNQNDLSISEIDGTKHLSCTRRFQNLTITAELSNSDYGFLMYFYYYYNINSNNYVTASEQIRALGVTVARAPWNSL